MNILQLISSRGLFGAETVVLNLSQELEKQDGVHSIIGVFNNLHIPNLEIEAAAKEKGLPTIVFPCKGRVDRGTIVRVRQFIKEHSIDVVHSHGYKSNLYGVTAVAGLSTFCVATCHNWLGDSLKMRLYSTLDRFILRYFDRIVAVSEEVKNKLLAARVSAKKIRIVKNGIPMEQFTAKNPEVNVRQQFGIAEDAFVFGTVGRLSAEKGHIYLLKAALRIVRKYPESAFLIVGEGLQFAALREEFGSKKIIFTGKREDVVRLYGCMDAFVLPSLTEGLPMALLEAAAFQLPIIASRVGDVPTVIVESESGVLVQPGNAESLFNAMSFVLENPESAKIFGIRVFEKVTTTYSSKKMASDYYKIYTEVVRERCSDGH